MDPDFWMLGCVLVYTHSDPQLLYNCDVAKLYHTFIRSLQVVDQLVQRAQDPSKRGTTPAL